MLDKLKDQHGHWTVQKDQPPIRDPKTNQLLIPVTCTCGTTGYRRLDKLIYGKSESCGCHRGDHLPKKPWPTPNLRNDPQVQPGSQHNYWTALEYPYNPPGPDRNAVAEFHCRCGTVETRRTSTILTGESKSCGCYRKTAKRNQPEQ